MDTRFVFQPSEQDYQLFSQYLAMRHELVTQNGFIHAPQLIDWMIQDLAAELQRSGDKAYIQHACEAFGYTREHYYKHKIALICIQK